MADDADIANDYIDQEVLSALSKMRQNMKESKGTKDCVSCGDKIPDARRKLGFQLCLECASENERRKSLYAE